ncbi:hypothetical protein BH10ACT2_BH10ACT2_06160 [soil metagenome]
METGRSHRCALITGVHHLIATLLATPSQLEAAAGADESVPLLEFLLPVTGWAVLVAAFVVRRRRQPSSISA